jgi:hypothetical protein
MSENRFSAVLLSVEMDEPKVSLLSFLQEVAKTDRARIKMKKVFFIT